MKNVITPHYILNKNDVVVGILLFPGKEIEQNKSNDFSEKITKVTEI